MRDWTNGSQLRCSIEDVERIGPTIQGVVHGSQKGIASNVIALGNTTIAKCYNECPVMAWDNNLGALKTPKKNPFDNGVQVLKGMRCDCKVGDRGEGVRDIIILAYSGKTSGSKGMLGNLVATYSSLPLSSPDSPEGI